MSAGFDGKLYYNSATYATPTWVEIDIARDVSVPTEVGEVDSSDRGSAFKKYDVALIDMGLEFNATYRNGNAVFSALKTHVLARTSVEFAVMDGPIATTGSQGWRMTCKLTSMGLSQPLEDGQVVDFKAKPTYDATAGDPAWYTVP